MKKIVIAAFLLVFALGASAQTEQFTITKGDINWIKEDAYARVFVDLADAQMVKYDTDGVVKETVGPYREHIDGGEANMGVEAREISDFAATTGSQTVCKPLNFYTKKGGVKIVVSEETQAGKVAKTRMSLPEGASVKYNIFVKADTIDSGAFSAVGGISAARVGAAWMTGNMKVVEVATGEVIFEADIVKAKGFWGTTFTDRFAKLISSELLGNNIYKPAFGK